MIIASRGQGEASRVGSVTVLDQPSSAGTSAALQKEENDQWKTIGVLHSHFVRGFVAAHCTGLSPLHAGVDTTTPLIAFSKGIEY